MISVWSKKNNVAPGSDKTWKQINERSCLLRKRRQRDKKAPINTSELLQRGEISWINKVLFGLAVTWFEDSVCNVHLHGLDRNYAINFFLKNMVCINLKAWNKYHKRKDFAQTWKRMTKTWLPLGNATQFLRSVVISGA